jgi:metal-responsive CopG/Arc/MetJ family transcriptional regulator
MVRKPTITIQKGRNKAVLNVTVPPDLVEWLDTKVKEGVFSSRSHGVMRCLIEGKKIF